MTVVLALEQLYDAVAARFAAEGTAGEFVFGWRTPAQQHTGPRLAWVPGDPSGSLGRWLPARNPGRAPRPIGTLGELFTVHLSAQDPDAPEDERAQYKITRLLFDAWYRAVYLAARGTFEILSTNWIDAKNIRRFGAALRVVVQLQAELPDAPVRFAPFKVRGEFQLDDLDQTESIETEPAPPEIDTATTGDVALTGEQTIDDIAVVQDDVVLAWQQTDPVENGLYVVKTGAWERTDDALIFGFFVRVAVGTQHGGSSFQLTTPDPIVVDETPLTFEKP
jgi:hypothetical protein